MPAPEGYRILVFEELSEQAEENAPVDHLFSTLTMLRIVLILESFFSSRLYSRCVANLNCTARANLLFLEMEHLQVEMKRSVDRRPQGEVLGYQRLHS
jgi:hypothetical protein